jgi:hypothetical protein
MGRKYIKYQVVETGEIWTLYENDNPDVYKKAYNLYGKETLPFLNRFGEIIVLEFGEENE